jgi:hypothetical protein
MKSKKRYRREIEEYNPEKDERDDWRRVTRTHVGKIITGKVEIHFNEGEPLTVRKVEVVKTAE